MLRPDYIFETSWEVCQKVGGIYTVLSTRARSMTKVLGSSERVVFFGPWRKMDAATDFLLDPDTTATWEEPIRSLTGLSVQIGYWDIPGRPRCILVDFSPLFEIRDTLYFEMWEKYGVRSDLGYGDYDESCMFSIAAAKVMKAWRDLTRIEGRGIAIFNEWTTGMGLLYLKAHEDSLRTVFVTHATTVGRSIAGNGKPLYDNMPYFNGNQMAEELNVQAKHALERLAAHHADAFGTVSDVTDVECAQLLEKRADVVIPNGFEPDFIPTKTKSKRLRKEVRQRIISLAHVLYGKSLKSDDTLIIATSGRSEYRNKGIDAYIEAIARIASTLRAEDKSVLALILVPGWTTGARAELSHALSIGGVFSRPMKDPFISHRLHPQCQCAIYHHLSHHQELWGDKVYPIYVPSYLNGQDGILNIPYYDLLAGIDLTLFPSYYEPWGYTPLESIAFGVPTMTTDKSGFGMWVKNRVGQPSLPSCGVEVFHRNDHNTDALAEDLATSIRGFAHYPVKEKDSIAKAAVSLSQKAYWGEFYHHYESLFSKALESNKGDIC